MRSTEMNANELHRCAGRNVLWCAGDGGRGVCSSDVHHLVQKPVSAAEMQFTHATHSPRASQIAGRVVCGSKVDIAAEISDMWYQITAGKGSAYLTEQAEDAHHSSDAYEAQPEPRIRHSSHAWLFLLF